jgi:hypothetical protein
MAFLYDALAADRALFEGKRPGRQAKPLLVLPG